MTPSLAFKIGIFCFAAAIFGIMMLLNSWRQGNPLRYERLKVVAEKLVRRRAYTLTLGVLYVVPVLFPALPLAVNLAFIGAFLVFLTPAVLRFTVLLLPAKTKNETASAVNPVATSEAQEHD
jgi:hypothetical protein